jgi:hypothetical protein
MEIARLYLWRLLPGGKHVDAAEAATLILSWTTAYQLLHRVARVHRGQRVLLHGAAGAVGQALLVLGRLAGLELWGTARGEHVALVRELGATPIDYQREDFTRVLPGGFDVIVDGVGENGYRRSYAALKRGGLLCAIGFSASVQAQRQARPVPGPPIAAPTGCRLGARRPRVPRSADTPLRPEDMLQRGSLITPTRALCEGHACDSELDSLTYSIRGRARPSLFGRWRRRICISVFDNLARIGARRLCLVAKGRGRKRQRPITTLVAPSDRHRQSVRRGNPGHRHYRQSHAQKMPGLQDPFRQSSKSLAKTCKSGLHSPVARGGCPTPIWAGWPRWLQKPGLRRNDL